eukprot:jgi/Botrbrau1/11301/Bobra.0038s0064.1
MRGVGEQAFVDKLHANGQRWVPIVEPGIMVEPGYPTYESGMKAGVFILDFTREKPVLGVLWPGPSYFPDFISNKTEVWWSQQLETFYQATPFDGLWVDMSEPTSFCSSDQCHLPHSSAIKNAVTTTGGSQKPLAESLVTQYSPVLDNLMATLHLNASALDLTSEFDINDFYVKSMGQLIDTLIKILGRDLLLQLGGKEFLSLALCPYACTKVNAVDNPKSYARSNPPFAINNIDGDLKDRVPLNYHTVPVTAWHLDDISAYDAHNLYGHSMSRVSFRSVSKLIKKRTFILSRSTFVGSGAYTAHWTGDIKSSWEGLRSSIPDIMTNSLAGIPFMGADICGFNDYATEELCARWIAAGAFYPLARDHHADGYQELYRWEKVAKAGKAAIEQRYALLPYLYTTLFYSTVTGNPIMRPLFFAAPADEVARNSSYQWMFGDGLMAAPLIEAGTDTFKAYFPQGTWYNLRTHARLVSKGNVETVKQGIVEPANAYVAGGHIIPMAKPAMTTREVMASDVSLLVGLSGGGRQQLRVAKSGCISGNDVACGQLYLDDGEQLELGKTRDHHLTFTAIQGSSGGKIWVLFGGNPLSAETSECATDDTAAPIVTISEITVLGAQSGTSFALVETSASAPNVTALAAAKIESEATATLRATGKITYDKAAQKLTISGLQFGLKCPTGFEISWK